MTQSCIHTADDHAVVIVGAGPVGLLLACELALAGCAPLVLEQALDPRSPVKEAPFGLRGLSVATVEALDRRGLMALLLDEARLEEASPARRPAGHFAGIDIFADQVDGARWPHRLPHAGAPVAVAMARLETVLAERAMSLGVTIRRGCEVRAIAQTDEAVTLEANGRTLRARWLVGCDGGRSAVRKAAGLGFAGTEPEFTGYSVRARLADPERLRPGRNVTVTGVYLFAPPDTIWMADFDGGAFHRTHPLTREHVEAVLRRVSGTDVAVTALDLASTWTDRAFLAGAYRSGRVLLAGDAAHVHSPLGGQGLNLGLGDAINLGWKLAAAIRGDAPAGLLDSYAAERRPVAGRVLEWSRAQVALLRPDPGSRALEAILRDLIATREGATYVAERVWGVGVRYDLGDAHPLVGRSAPDLRAIDGRSLNALLREGGGLLLDAQECSSLRALADRWGGRIRYVAAAAGNPLEPGALLVRPDGIVAWAGHEAADEDAIAHAAARWFGAPPGFPAQPSPRGTIPGVVATAGREPAPPHQ